MLTMFRGCGSRVNIPVERLMHTIDVLEVEQRFNVFEANYLRDLVFKHCTEYELSKVDIVGDVHKKTAVKEEEFGNGRKEKKSHQLEYISSQ